MRGQPPPYSSGSPSSLTPPIASTSAGGGMGPNGRLLSPKMEPSTTPRLYKVGQPEKFIPDSLPSSGNKKLPGNVGEAQLTTHHPHKWIIMNLVNKLSISLLR